MITAKEVRLISSSGEQMGIFSPSVAIKMAEDEGLDLVEISPDAVPPVCKIVDYGKHKFRQKKKQHEAKKKQKVILVKEIKLKLKTEKHDIEFKEKHIERFLADGNKAKVRLSLYGREMVLLDRGIEILNKIAEELQDIAAVEQPPVVEGKQIIMVLAPKK
ncbi:MAG: translation initiation factor IF-3 [Candidatus Schekmanbacteria bacterium]|nr:translation initiation factor IF-3 [Candidatus Schekmanbacteria bacterium]